MEATARVATVKQNCNKYGNAEYVRKPSNEAQNDMNDEELSLWPKNVTTTCHLEERLFEG